MGLDRVGMECAFQVEIDPFCRKILERHWPGVPKFDDVRRFPPDDVDFKIDLLAGGFPCFPAGTPVDTDMGPRAIETVRAGDIVVTHKNRLRAVSGTMRRMADQIVRIKVPGSRAFEVTREHPFRALRLDIRRGLHVFGPASWVEAQDLDRTHLLARPKYSSRASPKRRVGFSGKGHEWVPVDDVVILPKRAEVYNIEVEEDDSYVASSFVVHNCKQVSNARTAQVAVPEGLEGKDSGLWFEMARIIRRMGPRWVVIENVGPLASRGLSTILWEISKCGYDAAWQTISAGLLGAPHLRRRLFVVGVKNTYREGLEGHVFKLLAHPDHWRRDAHAARSDRGDPAPRLCGGASGIPPRLVMARERLTALGNAVVPQVGEFIGKRILEADRALFGGNGGDEHPDLGQADGQPDA